MPWHLHPTEAAVMDQVRAAGRTAFLEHRDPDAVGVHQTECMPCPGDEGLGLVHGRLIDHVHHAGKNRCTAGAANDFRRLARRRQSSCMLRAHSNHPPFDEPLLQDVACGSLVSAVVPDRAAQQASTDKNAFRGGKTGPRSPLGRTAHPAHRGRRLRRVASRTPSPTTCQGMGPRRLGAALRVVLQMSGTGVPHRLGGCGPIRRTTRPAQAHEFAGHRLAVSVGTSRLSAAAQLRASSERAAPCAGTAAGGSDPGDRAVLSFRYQSNPARGRVLLVGGGALRSRRAGHPSAGCPTRYWHCSGSSVFCRPPLCPPPQTQSRLSRRPTDRGRVQAARRNRQADADTSVCAVMPSSALQRSR